MKIPTMQALGEKLQNFDLIEDRPSKKQRNDTYTRKSSNGKFGEKGKIAPRGNDQCPRCLGTDLRIVIVCLNIARKAKSVCFRSNSTSK